MFASANWQHMAQRQASPGCWSTRPSISRPTAWPVAVAPCRLRRGAEPWPTSPVPASASPSPPRKCRPALTPARSLNLLATSDVFHPGDYASAVLSNVVTNETSVRGVAQKVFARRGGRRHRVRDRRAGPTQYTDAIRTLEIPLRFNPAAQYPIAALSTTDELETALEFIKFVQGDSGQTILREHGFVPPANIACPCHARMNPAHPEPRMAYAHPEPVEGCPD